MQTPTPVGAAVIARVLRTRRCPRPQVHLGYQPQREWTDNLVADNLDQRMTVSHKRCGLCAGLIDGSVVDNRTGQVIA